MHTNQVPSKIPVPEDQLKQSFRDTMLNHAVVADDTQMLHCVLTDRILTRGELLAQSSVYARGLSSLFADRHLFTEAAANTASVCFIDAQQSIDYHMAFFATLEPRIPFVPVNWETFRSYPDTVIDTLDVGLVFIPDSLLAKDDAASFTSDRITASDIQVVIVASDPQLPAQTHDALVAKATNELFPSKRVLSMSDFYQLGARSDTAVIPRDNDTPLFISTAATTGPGKFAAIAYEGINTVYNGYFSNPVLLGGDPGRPFASSLCPKWLTYMVACMLMAVFTGRKVVLDPRTNIEQTIKNIRAFDIKEMFMSQGQILNIEALKLPDNYLAGAEIVFTGGERMYLDQFRRYQKELRRLGVKMFISGTGLTETSNNMGVCAINLQTGEPIDILPGSNLLFYKLLPDIEFRVADPETNLPVPYGAIGELQIKDGPRISKEYVNQPELTASSWTSDRYFKTGDANIAVEIPTPDGGTQVLVAVCCRYQDGIIGTDGNHHWVFEAEAAVQPLPFVRDVMVVHDPKDKHGFVVNIVTQTDISSEEAGRQIAEVCQDKPFNVRVCVYPCLYTLGRDPEDTTIVKRNRKAAIEMATS
jgi:acyl-CoA synthetase (AMP-forming)/AMP-acid ligase II